jgi:hypothetical protein
MQLPGANIDAKAIVEMLNAGGIEDIEILSDSKATKDNIVCVHDTIDYLF